MKLPRLFHSVPVALVYLCAATTAAQSVGAAVLWKRGALTQGKITRYAAILYGLQGHELEPQKKDRKSGEHAGGQTRGAASVAQRVQGHPLVSARLAAVSSEMGSIHDWTNNLRSDRERHEFVKTSFEDKLTQLENDATTTALQEIQRTLEILQPKQAKDLLLRFLEDEGLDAEDDVMADVVAIVRTMPQEKLKKLLGEFKTEKERETLHRILLEIGEIERLQSAETKS